MSKETSRRLAIMFTDLVGYSSMMVADEHEAINRLVDYRDILCKIIKKYKGRVIDFAGDSIFASFESAVDAVDAALKIQEALQQYNESHIEKLQTRIGVHYGDVLEKDGGIFGDDVNIAARLEPLGDPLGVCISETVYRELDAQLQNNCICYGRPVLKNIGSSLKIFHLFQGPVNSTKRLHILFRRIKCYLGDRPSMSLPLATVFMVLSVYLLASVFFKPVNAVHYVELGEIRNLSQGEMPEYYTIGIVDEIRTRLKDIPNLYLSVAEDDVGAEVILTGSMQQLSDRVRISYQIIRRADDSQIGGSSIDGSLENMLDLQSELADKVAKELASELSLTLLKEKPVKQQISAEAYQYYLQAREYAKRPDDKQTLNTSSLLYKNALQIDDKFAAAYAGLCEVYWGMYLLERRTELVRQAEQACLQAESLDENLAEVQVALGKIYRGRGRYLKSIAAYNKAIQLEPRNIAAYVGLADVYTNIDSPQLAEQTYLRAIGLQAGNWEAWTKYGRYQFNTGQFDKAEASFSKVISLIPDNVNAYANLGAALLFQGRFKQAARVFSKQAELEPSATILSNVATMYYYDGDYKGAKGMYEKAIELSPKQCLYWSNLADALHQLPGSKEDAINADKQALELCDKEHKVNPENKIILITKSRLLARLGMIEEALSEIKSYKLTASSDPDVQLYLALAFLQSGDIGAMKNALELAVEQGYPRSLVLVEPEFMPYRDDAWFKSMIQSVDTQ